MPEKMEDDDDFQLFALKIKRLAGVDLSQYKEAQMKRRLTTLRVKRGFSSFAHYYAALQRDPALLAEFLERMTINVSEFWRNANRWEIVEKCFLPELFNRRQSLKCWSAACSTGEEPYTLALILQEHGWLPHAQITATDIDDKVLSYAKAGIYAERSIRDVPPHVLHKYFRLEKSSWRLVEEIKRNVRFHKHDLLADPFGDHYDLIICRNVMIYFTEDAKKRLYHKFARALGAGGVLFVGSTEQIFSPQQYQLECVETFFYRKI